MSSAVWEEEKILLQALCKSVICRANRSMKFQSFLKMNNSLGKKKKKKVLFQCYAVNAFLEHSV